mmetsp:Transcript_11832/g.26886  ORF Transcript_11832/g.26886 Transcript_11832/m.26886 type:complete len:628 (+) Transcript_11832:117-2000(+)
MHNDALEETSARVVVEPLNDIGQERSDLAAPGHMPTGNSRAGSSEWGDGSRAASSRPSRSRGSGIQELVDIAPSSPGKNLRSSQVMQRLAVLDKRLRTKDAPPPPWIKTEQADTMVGIAIVANAVFVGVDVEFSDDNTELVFWTIESCFLVVFLLEILLRIRAEVPRIRKYFDGWGIFDVTVTATGCVDAWLLTPLSGIGGEDNPMSSFTVFRLLRLVRIVRLVRVLRMFRDLVLLVRTLQESVSAVLWMCILLGIITYTGSILTVVLLGQQYLDDDSIQDHFGNLGNALFSHFCMVTLEGWIEIAEAAMDKNRLWAVYFVAMISLTNFALVNLMIGVVVEGILRFSSEQETELNAFVAESEQFRITLEHLWKHAELDCNGEITRADVRELLSQDETKLIMDCFGINLNVPPPMLHTIMDLRRDGPTTFHEFYEACLRLCGSKKSIHSMFVQHDICECQRRITAQLQRLEEKLQADGTAIHMANGHSKPPQSGMAKSALPSQGCAVVADLADRISRLLQVQQYMMSGVQALKLQTTQEQQIQQLSSQLVSRYDGKPNSPSGISHMVTPAGREDSLGGWNGCARSIFSNTCSPERSVAMVSPRGLSFSPPSSLDQVLPRGTTMDTTKR